MGGGQVPRLPQQQKYLQPKCPPMPRTVLVPFAEIAGSQTTGKVRVRMGRPRVHLLSYGESGGMGRAQSSLVQTMSACVSRHDYE